MYINLDENERIDQLVIQGVVYNAGDIPSSIAEQILKIKVSFFTRFLGKNIEQQREPIIKAYLEIKNEKVETRYRSKRHYQQLILYISNRLDEERKDNIQV